LFYEDRIRKSSSDRQPRDQGSGQTVKKKLGQDVGGAARDEISVKPELAKENNFREHHSGYCGKGRDNGAI